MKSQESFEELEEFSLKRLFKISPKEVDKEKSGKFFEVFEMKKVLSSFDHLKYLRKQRKILNQRKLERYFILTVNWKNLLSIN